jgi:glycosyltransferase involved in cell wall biosynthesis
MYQAITGKDEDGEHVPWFWFGIPLKNYTPCYEPTDGPVFINTIAEHKGADLMVEAAVEYDIPVRMYGPIDDAYYDRVIRPILSKSMKSVEMPGEIGWNRVARTKTSSASFILSIWPEPGSRITMESLALGCPCVVTDCGCLPHYIEDGVNGAVVDRDPESIYQGYLRVLAGGKTMRKTARETALAMFGIDKMVDNIEILFDRVMSGERWYL